MQRRLWLVVTLTVVLGYAGATAPVAGFDSDIPARLSDEEFWKLSSESSEADGYFSSDNLVSNERVFAQLVPALESTVKPGGVYFGVGPEQNFTYIAATRPKIAIITDVRRGNLHLQLMYKALFELSADRAEFVSRLFTKIRPAHLTQTSPVLDIMNAYWDIQTASEPLYAANLAAIRDHLTKTRRLPLTQDDLDGIARVYRAFYWYGPAITWGGSTQLTFPATGRLGGTTFWDLMVQASASGVALSYLASHDRFLVVKDLQSRNLVVPVVGNFSGPKALRAVGAYVKSHGATVSAFYVSNVESYLKREGSWGQFCANVATWPLDDRSVYIRPSPVMRQPLQFIQLTRSGDGTLISTPKARQPLQFLQFIPVDPAQAGGPRFVTTVVPSQPGAPAVPTASSSPAVVELQAGLVPIAAEVQASCARLRSSSFGAQALTR